MRDDLPTAQLGPDELADVAVPVASAVVDPPFAPGSRIGRYLVLAHLGSGGMGDVLAVYDPELDRRVALKLLKAQRGDRVEARARLRREAQALAALNHPHVITVHDVGVIEGQVYVVMEYVQGDTLGQYLAAAAAARRPDWREILSVFMAAGRGLAAAHAAGLVHRDFKPGNVMIGTDGRVRVMDFGLVRRYGEEASVDAADSVDAPSGSAELPVLESGETEALDSWLRRLSASSSTRLSDKLTQTGASIGTPAYMAPEQWRLEPVSARTDQFSFCVALHEALYGVRPFVGDSYRELARAVVAGKLVAPPPGHGVPAWLRKVLVRGLARDPDDRYPTMEALLAALADDPSVRRKKWAAGLGVVGLVVAAAWSFAAQRTHEAPRCEGLDGKLAGAWDEDRRAVLRDAFATVQLGYAGETWQRVEGHLDAYAAAWVGARIDACEAADRGEQSQQLLDRRMACLDDRLGHLRATVDVLATVDEGGVKKAVGAVLNLPSLDDCADAEALLREVPLPDDPELAAAVEALDARLREATAEQELGHFQAALDLARAVLVESETLAHPPLQVRARVRVGLLEAALGQFPAAKTTLEQAYHAALRLRMFGDAASAADKLVYVYGLGLAKYAEAEAWGPHALSTAALGESEAMQAATLNDLGIVAALQSKHDDAWDYFEQAVAIKRTLYGPDHPLVASSLDNLGNVARIRGDLERARELQTRALTIRETALGPAHPAVANTLGNLGNLAMAEGELAEARRLFEKELVIKCDALGHDHPAVAVTHTNLCTVAAELGELDVARRECERALVINEAAMGLEHAEVALSLINLGELDLLDAKLDDALARFERARTIQSATLEPDDPARALLAAGLGEVLLRLGRSAEARTLLEQLLPLLERETIDTEDIPRLRARARFALARARFALAGSDATARAAARELAVGARADLDERYQSELDAWLAAHPM